MSDINQKTDFAVKKSRENWFSKIASLFNRPKIDDSLWLELEELLIGADVGVITADRLIQRVKRRVRDEKLSESEQVQTALKDEMVLMLSSGDKTASLSADQPVQLVLVVGVNGSGKTTSIAKLANFYKSKGKSVIIGAADTFRAAAIDQLKLWGERVGVPVVAHQPGADPGAVVFDTVQAGQNRKAEVIIIDTAGRLQTRSNLMEELKKIQRVAAKSNLPQKVLLVMDATTGQNGLSQARHFTEAVGVTDIFLTKLDGTARGGIMLAIADELKIPITYIGTGEQLDDMVPFDARAFVEAIFAG
jgi:fused signal recognition particle receptor